MATKKATVGGFNEAQVAPPCPLMGMMQRTAALTEAALVDAVKGGVPIKITIGRAAVTVTDDGGIISASSDVNPYHDPMMFAAQAGLMLGAARAATDASRD